MIGINLLPHREEKRRARRQQFYALSGLVVVISALIVFMVHGVNATRIGAQEEKNAFLKREIATLDKEINEIKRLRDQTGALLARKQVIENLQSNRAEAVTLLNDLARLTPEGVYLRSVKQSGQNVGLAGVAQSSARVSNLMHNLETSRILDTPTLVEIRATMVDKRRLAQFSMNVHVRRSDQGGAKPAGGKGGKP
ncbi:MAG: PilN domain-containing protein [Rhodocyclaceae bacterium]|nr:PilN domain-containing protein [Rhodocyclaceae bacterium]